MSYLKKDLDGLCQNLSDLVDKKSYIAEACKMKRALIITFVIMALGNIICYAESHNELIFCNEDSFCVKLYPSLSACINEDETDFYIFNGYCDQVTVIDENDGIAIWSILGNNYYIRTKDLSMNTHNPEATNSFLELYLNHSMSFIQRDGTEKTIPSESSVLILGHIKDRFLVEYLGSIGLISWAFPANNITTGNIRWLIPMQEAVSIAMSALYEKYEVIDSEFNHIYAYCSIHPSKPNLSIWSIYVHKGFRLENEAYYIEINAVNGSVIVCEFHDDFAG